MRVFLVAPDPVGLPHQVRQIETLGHEVVGSKAYGAVTGNASEADAIVAWAAREAGKTGEVLDDALELGQKASVPTLCVDVDEQQASALNQRGRAVFIPPGRLADGLTACERAVLKARA